LLPLFTYWNNKRGLYCFIFLNFEMLVLYRAPNCNLNFWKWNDNIFQISLESFVWVQMLRVWTRVSCRNYWATSNWLHHWFTMCYFWLCLNRNEPEIVRNCVWCFKWYFKILRYLQNLYDLSWFIRGRPNCNVWELCKNNIHTTVFFFVH